MVAGTAHPQVVMALSLIRERQAISIVAAMLMFDPERVNDDETADLIIQAGLLCVCFGGLIQAAIGLSGGCGGFRTKRSGLSRKALSSARWRAAWMGVRLSVVDLFR
jgi:hypothetical protein